MEYADILSARNARPIDGVHYPTVTSLPDFCTGYRSTPEKRSCYRYFPRIVAQTHMREGMPAAEAREQALSICTSYQELQDRVGCLAGYGVYSAYNIITDRARAIRICGQFESMADRAACTVGIVSVASEERQGLIVAYCREIPDESLRADCYQAVFFYLNRLGVPRETSRELCTADALCLDGAAQFADDAWQRVIDRYGR